MKASETIRAAREAKGLSQRGLADLAGVSPKQVYNVEAGENTTVDFLVAIAKVLGLKNIPVSSEVELSVSPPMRIGGGMEVVDINPRMIGVPVEAYVAAGHGGWEEAARGETVSLPDFLFGPNDFVVRAMGESMVDEGIDDGDYLIVERRPNGIATHGDLVIAWLNDGLVIKRWYRRSGRKFLESANEEMGWRPRELTASDVFEIQGIVRHIVKRANGRGKESRATMSNVKPRPENHHRSGGDAELDITPPILRR